MKHLDDRVSDLVDDRLDHEERDRALAHVAGCQHCREAVDMERYAKGVLTTLPDMDMPRALVGKLVGLAEPGGPLPSEHESSDSAVHVAPWGPARSTRPGAAHRNGSDAGHDHHDSARPKFVDRHRRGVRAAAGGMVSTGAVLVMLASLGAPAGTGRDQTPASVVPPMEEFTMEHARSSGGLPFAEPASIIVPALRSVDDGSNVSPGIGMVGISGVAGTAGVGTSPAGEGLGSAGDRFGSSRDGR